MVRKLFLMGGEEDDLFQEGLMGIISAVKLYDENKTEAFPPLQHASKPEL